MRILGIGESISPIFNRFSEKAATLPLFVKSIFSSFGSKREESPYKVSSQNSTIRKTQSFSFKCFALIGMWALTRFGTKEILGAPPSVFIPDLVAQEELPFSAQWIKTDLFDFSSTNTGPFTVYVQQINGSTLPQGLTFDNIPMNGVGYSETTISSITKLVKINHLIAWIEAANCITFDVTNPQNPTNLGTVSLPSTINDIACVSNPQICYLVNQQGLYIVDLRIAPPSLISSYFLPITGSAITSLDPSSNLLVIMNISSTFNLEYGDPALGSEVGFQIINISNPLTPELFTSISLPTDLFYPTLSTNNGVGYTVTYNTPSNNLISINLTHPLKAVVGNVSLSSYGYNSYQVEAVENYLLAASLNTILFYDTSDITNPKMVSSLEKRGYISLDGNDNLYVQLGAYDYFNGFQITQYDISNKSNPYLVANNFPYLSSPMVISDEYLYAPNGVIQTLQGQQTSLTISTKGDLISISGTPNGGTKGNYTFKMFALDANGISVGKPQQFNFFINPAVTLIGKIKNQLFVVGKVNTLTFTSIFNQFANEAITQSLTPLQSSCTFVSLGSTGTLTCFSTPNDVGTTNSTLRGTDPNNAYAETTFQIKVAYGPVVANKIANFIAEVGVPVLFNTSSTFIDQDQVGLSYLFSGPTWFSYSHQMLSGTPSVADLGTSTNTLSAVATNTLTTHTIFQITVQPLAAPTINSQIAASIQNKIAPRGDTFFLSIPKQLFEDPLGRAEIEASYQYYSSLPSYLTMDAYSDPHYLFVHGIPGWGDVGFAQNNVDVLSFTACRKNSQIACVSNQSLVTVSGMTLLALISQIVSGAIFILGAYKFRWLPWNHCKKVKYKKPPVNILIGEENFTFDLSKVGVGRKSKGKSGHVIDFLFDWNAENVRAFVTKEENKEGCLKDRFYISNGADVLPEANIKLHRIKNQLYSPLVTDPGTFSQVTLQVINSGERILAEFNLTFENRSQPKQETGSEN